MNLSALFKAQGGRRYLKDYIRLIISFFGCLVVISVYQQLRLYGQGVLDGLLNQNLLTLWMHQLGFASLVALLLAPVFGGLEQWKPGWGFRACIVLLMTLLFNELVLTEFYLEHYALPGLNLESVYGSQNIAELFTLLLVGGIVLVTSFRVFYQQSKRFYRVIGRMFPITIVLMSLFLATLLSEKRPVNLNKNQYLMTEVYRAAVGSETYDGSDPYPLWRPQQGEDVLGPLIHWPEQPPNIVIIAVDGLSGPFVGMDAPYRAFVPFLNSLVQNSLYWPNTIANAADADMAFPLLAGSLPQGAVGFTKQHSLPARWTLFSLLKKSGYRTSFQYGGNAALPGWDRLLYEERIDEIVDQKAFGTRFNKQETDAAGISLGYPDHLLYERYFKTRVANSQPFLDYFQNLSSRAPFNFPGKESYIKEVEEIGASLELSPRERRVLKKNKELAGALRYADKSLRDFFAAYKKKKEFARTVFLIVGTHHPKSMATQGDLRARTVPLMLYSPLLRKTGRIEDLVTQLDLTPALIHSLRKRYSVEGGEKAPWLSPGLAGGNRKGGWPLPLYESGRDPNTWILGDSLVQKNKIRNIGSDLSLGKPERLNPERESQLVIRKAKERYALENDALIPREEIPFGKLIPPPSKMELVWIHSVFNGSDYDGAYQTARDLAFSGQRDRAEVLCRYILMQVPGHVDSEILLGRIHAWEKDYQQAEAILKQVVQKHPVYEDGYAALLDVYYWSGQNDKAQFLLPLIREQLGNHQGLLPKLERAGIRPDALRAKNEIKPEQVVKTHFE